MRERETQHKAGRTRPDISFDSITATFEASIQHFSLYVRRVFFFFFFMLVFFALLNRCFVVPHLWCTHLRISSVFTFINESKMLQFMYDINLQHILFYYCVNIFDLEFTTFFRARLMRACAQYRNPNNKRKIFPLILSLSLSVSFYLFLSGCFIRFQNWQTATCQKPKLINTGKCSCLAGSNVRVCTLNTEHMHMHMVFIQFPFFASIACVRSCAKTMNYKFCRFELLFVR